MKKYITLLLATFFVVSAYAQGSIDFKNAPIPMVLNLYGKLAGKQLVIEPAVTNQTKLITIRLDGIADKEQATKELATVLQKQAGVVFEKFDEKRLAVKLEKK